MCAKTSVAPAMEQGTGTKIALLTSPSQRPSTAPARPTCSILPATRGPSPRKTSPHKVQDLSLMVRDQEKRDCIKKFEDILTVKSRNCDKFEADLENFDDSISVAGRFSLDSSIQFFEHIDTPEFVLKFLKEGFASDFLGPVPKMERGNNKSYYEHQDYVNAHFEQMAREGKVKFVDYVPYVVNPLQVAVQPNKKRVILDCSRLNDYIHAPKFKMEDYKAGLDFFRKDGWMITFDLRDGYHHVKVREDFSDYLGFRLDTPAGPRYGICLVAMFGQCDIPWLFTKILRPLVRHWRAEEMATVVYLDDGFDCAGSYEESLLHSEHIRKDLLRCGAVFGTLRSRNGSPHRRLSG